ncbi:hypothetical protein ACFQH2_06195 [Natronoarchaeum sp. GCM10025703]
MLYQGANPHPAHETFGDSIACDYLHFEQGISPDAKPSDQGSLTKRIKTGFAARTYDIVIAEGSAPLQTALVTGTLSPATTTIYLGADRTFQTLPDRHSHYFWQAVKPLSSQALDGIISVSKLVASWTHPYITADTHIVRPPISDAKYPGLQELPVNSDGEHLLCVGRPSPSKRFSVLTDILDTRPDATATVLGAGHDSMGYASHDRITTPGFVPIADFVTHF